MVYTVRNEHAMCFIRKSLLYSFVSCEVKECGIMSVGLLPLVRLIIQLWLGFSLKRRKIESNYEDVLGL